MYSWGICVVIPPRYREQVLQDPHKCRMDNTNQEFREGVTFGGLDSIKP